MAGKKEIYKKVSSKKWREKIDIRKWWEKIDIRKWWGKSDVKKTHTHTYPEALDGVLQIDESARLPREDLSHGEWLGKELLDLAGPGHRELVVFRELVHP